MSDFQNLLDNVIEDEAEEDNLNPENKVVPSVDVSEELENRMTRREAATLTAEKSVCTTKPPVGGISKESLTMQKRLMLALYRVKSMIMSLVARSIQSPSLSSLMMARLRAFVG